MTDKKDNKDSWDNFCGSNFLKASDITDVNVPSVVQDVAIFSDDDGHEKPRLTLGRGDEDFLFDLNVTNANFCKNNGVTSPRNLIGKKLYFKKVLVNSPKTKKEVESLRICKIE